MNEAIITLKGISRARQSAVRSITRLIRFPDGMTRHITLPGWQWAVFDRYDRANSVLGSEQVVQFAFEAAEADSDPSTVPFEQKVRHHLSVFLTVGVPWTSDYIPRKANDF